MFKTIYVLAGYNNYLNRMLKIEQSIEDYYEYGGADIAFFTGINFNPNDEVTTELVLNIGDLVSFDYIIVTSESDDIVSRWFVIEKSRIRAGQWKILLRRDVVADYWNLIKTAPCFIEKAMLSVSNPLIFNKEDMSFNQIKTEEVLLTDKTACPWIVGYISKDRENLSGNIYSNRIQDLGAYGIGTSIENWYDGRIYEYSNLSDYADEFRYVDGSQMDVSFKIKNQYKTGTYANAAYYKATFDAYGQYVSCTEDISLSTVQKLRISNTESTKSALELASAFIPVMNRNGQQIKGEVTRTLNSNDQQEIFRTLTNLNSKLIVDTDGRVFELSLKPTGIDTTSTTVVKGSTLYNYFNDVITNVAANGGVIRTLTNDYSSSFEVNNVGVKIFQVELLERKDLEIYYEFYSAGVLTTEDAPYDIFAIPYGEIDVYDASRDDQFLVRTDPVIAIQTAFSMLKNHPGIIYDMQILPYCPIQDLTLNIWQEIYIDSSKQYSRIMTDSDDELVGIIFHVPNSKFSFNIEYAVEASIHAIDRKINSECDLWRLCSPNYGSSFDFNVEKNGTVQYFNVDCEYKPHTPYIHVNPEFGGLYGQDFNDPRGLICGGDFSIAAVSDQWQQYQIQNKNFQNIFDRQIENMEINNSIQHKLDKWTAVAGTLQGGMSGAAIGAMLPGGGLGAGLGLGVAGALASGIAGAADVRLNQQLRNEALDFTKDMFGYQLGNIRALPNTLLRVSAFNNNNKFFPILEYYTCTDEEKEALRNKIKYNGMTVMAIGKIEDYILPEETYIKGKIIRLEIPEDYHMVSTIVEEINKGLYINGGTLHG